MIELQLKQTSIRLDFSFFAVLALFFWLDKDGFGLIALSVCAAHELAHLLVMAICGIKPDSITFYGAGIRITAPETEFCSNAVQTAVYSAGCVMNFLLATILWRVGYVRAAAISLFTGCFNLVPIGEFDGRRLLRIFLISKAKPEKVDSLEFTIGVCCAIALAVIMIVCQWGTSPTLIITAAYIIVMSMRRV